MRIFSFMMLTGLLSSFIRAYGPEAPDWRVVNDTVMGGVSASSATPLEKGVVRFAGILSLENNGGFASIRADSREFAFPGDGVIVLKVRGDGRTYTLDLRTGERQGAFSYKQAFATGAGEVTDVRLPLGAFRPTAFGRAMPAASPLDPARVVSLGFMLADKQPGPFRLDVMSIGFEAAPPPKVGSPADLIDLAIHRGVPLFNQGSPAACAAVYETAAHALLLMTDEQVPGSVKTRLARDLDKMEDSMSPHDRAWALRHALDRARAGM